MPSYSIGFWVASTRNGSGSGRGSPSIVTWRSCIASSSAACVFGGVRLISSASSTLVKTGPGRNARSPPCSVIVPSEVRREHVRRELDAAELEPERAGDRVRDQRLRHAGDALEQDVAADEQCAEDPVDGSLLADGDLRHLGHHAVAQALHQR